MPWSWHFLLSLLPLSGLALKLRSEQCAQTGLIQSTVTKSHSAYTLQHLYQGDSFLSDDWTYFTGPDPTHGLVNFQTQAAAIKKKLAVVENGVAILAVDDFSVVKAGGKRDSVRISTSKQYNGGLFIADIQAIPYGCSIWPAYWSVGAKDWPNGGEIDVIEGTNNQLKNQYTLHSGPGCSLPTTSNSSVKGQLINTKCTSSPHTNSGCGFLDPNSASYGINFNKGEGGVFAHLWQDNGITIWRFFRNSIPQDIIKKQPDPSQWGPPVAFFPSTHCDIQSHFSNHSLVLDITICGDFANSTYPHSGCPGTCAQAVANSANFKNAKWEINSISVYQAEP